ncbi:MAG TPA: hypothetical protein VMR17_14405 [Xanthobacteraceae bacterium]|nr:hypothetical protein [Xanthobacteraceae bacterium]
MTGTGAYIRIFIATAAVIIGGAVAINLVVDPYDVSRLVRVRGFNDDKAREEGFARLRKPFDLWRRHYDGVVLGSSQVERGIDTDNPTLAARGLTLYNAGISEERPFEQALLLKHAVEVSGVRFAIVSLDFLRYVGGGGRPDFLPQDWNRWRGVDEYLKTLISYTTLADSAATVAASWAHRPSLQHGPDGLMNAEAFERIGVPHVRELFNAVDAVYLNSAYAPVLQGRAALERDGFDHTALRDMLATAHRTGVRLYFFITPSHAQQFEIMSMLGLIPLYQEWESEVTCELARDGEGAQSFPLWDFSGYNSVTTEPVPPLASKAVMRWYFDPVHYKPVVGRFIEDRLLDMPADALSGVDDFGVKLTLDTLNAHFASIAHSRQEYLAAHPDFVGSLAALDHREPPTAAAAADDAVTPRPCRGE